MLVYKNTSIQTCMQNSGVCRKQQIQCVRKVAVHLLKLLEVMSTRIYTGLKSFNFIRRHFLQICVRKVAVRLLKMLEVMSTSFYTGLKTFNFIRKHFLQICVRNVAVRLLKMLEVMSTGQQCAV
jgi:hypothetical protein